MHYPEISKPGVEEMPVRPNLDHQYALGGDLDANGEGTGNPASRRVEPGLFGY